MATAWGELEFALGKGPTGVVKQGSYSLEYQEGESKEWRAIGGRVVEKWKGPGTIRVRYELKGIASGEFKDQGEETSLTITPKDKKGETLTFAKGLVSYAPTFSDDGGYGTIVTFESISKDEGKTGLTVGEGSGLGV